VVNLVGGPQSGPKEPPELVKKKENPGTLQEKIPPIEGDPRPIPKGGKNGTPKGPFPQRLKMCPRPNAPLNTTSVCQKRQQILVKMNPKKGLIKDLPTGKVPNRTLTPI